MLRYFSQRLWPHALGANQFHIIPHITSPTLTTDDNSPRLARRLRQECAANIVTLTAELYENAQLKQRNIHILQDTTQRHIMEKADPKLPKSRTASYASWHFPFKNYATATDATHYSDGNSRPPLEEQEFKNFNKDRSKLHSAVLSSFPS